MKNINNIILPKFGVMQGRLVNQERLKIQSFPWKNWKNEFEILNENKFNLLEWTVDDENFFKNPINTIDGRKTIKKLKKKFKIQTYSLTADFFMQKPFFKEQNIKKLNLCFKKLKTILINANKINIKFIIIPLVDNSSLPFSKMKYFIEKICEFKKILKSNKQMILFESDFTPKNLLKFLKELDSRCFGINYDTGNSASLGYTLNDEIPYFKYVKNVHLKDRSYETNTKRLGRGDFDFKRFFNFILKSEYKGNFIFQTARSKSGKHLKEILVNKSYIINLIKKLR